MSTPRREAVEHRVAYGGACVQVAEAARAFKEALDEADGGLEPWDQGYAHASAVRAEELAERFQAMGELQLRVAEADRATRAAHAHLAALGHVDELNELREMRKANAEVGADTFGPDGAPFRYVAEVGERQELPTAQTDKQREGYRLASGGDTLHRRVYAVVAEEPVCVAVEGDGEWTFTEEVP